MSKQELDRVRIIQRVLDKQLSQRAAAQALGIGPRRVRRCCRALQRDGPEALKSRRRGRRSNRRLPDHVRARKDRRRGTTAAALCQISPYPV